MELGDAHGLRLWFWEIRYYQTSQKDTTPVGAASASNRLLGLSGITVVDVSFVGTNAVEVDVALRRRRLVCPRCPFSTQALYDTRPWTRWRHLDVGRWQVLVRARVRRLECPQHAVRVKAIPFARARSGFTRDFEDLVAYVATKTDKTTITGLSRLDWDTVGRVCERAIAEAWTGS